MVSDFTARLRDKVVLITGAARGMGEAAARRLAAEGAKVVVCDILEAEGKAVAEDLGDSARFVRLDVTSADQWRDAVAYAEREFSRLDVLVNNAGILGFGALAEMPQSEYQRIIDVNQVGVFLGMKAVAPTMIAQRSGSIVNISSVAGLIGSPGAIAYGASKFAVRGMTKSAAMELARSEVRVMVSAWSFSASLAQLMPSIAEPEMVVSSAVCRRNASAA